MTRGRKISDDELVEISGGMDGDVELDKIADIVPGPPASKDEEERTPPGGGTGLEVGNSSGGNSDVGPGN